MIEGTQGSLSVRHLCCLLGVPRSSYYAQRQPKRPRRIERQLEKKILQLHKEHRGALGSRGFSKALKKQGMEVGRHRMRGLMKSLGLVRRRARYAPAARGAAARPAAAGSRARG